MAEQPGESLDKLIERRKIPYEPNWLTGNLGRYPVVVDTPLTSLMQTTTPPEVVAPIQQSDLLKPLLMDIAKYGLSYAYKKYGGSIPISGAQTKYRKDVIIVGAGMAGLVAAYELKRAGHRVTIVETQDRVGGRVKTFDSKDGFKEGLYVDGEFYFCYNGEPRGSSQIDYHAVCLIVSIFSRSCG